MAKVKKMAFGGMGSMGRPGMGRPGMGRPGGMPAGMLGSGGPKMNPYNLPPANAQAAYSAPPPQANLTAMANKLPMAPANAQAAYSAPPPQANFTAMANNLPMAPAGMKKGGKVRTASQRADGIAQRGKTRA